MADQGGSSGSGGAPPNPRLPAHIIPDEVGRSTSGIVCLCDCLFKCSYVLLRNLFKALFVIFILTAISTTVFFLVLKPHLAKFYVMDASLAKFSLTGTNKNTLHHDLVINLTLRNPSRHMDINYEKIDIGIFYGRWKLSSTTLGGFCLDHKNTGYMGPLRFHGKNVVAFSQDEISQYEKEVADGFFEIRVETWSAVSYEIGWAKFGLFRPRYDWELKVPLNASKFRL